MEKQIDVLDFWNSFKLTDKEKIMVARDLVLQVLLDTGDPLLNHINNYLVKAEDKFN